MAVNYQNIGLGEPSTITHRVASVQIARGSTNEQQEILVLGDAQSSLGLAVVTDTTPASTAFGLVVREAVPQSTGPFAISSVSGVVQTSTGPIAVSSIAGPVTIRSSAANALVSVYQSTAADLNVTVANLSTTVNVSSLGGAVITRSSAANMLVSVYQSTAADLNVTVANLSTGVTVNRAVGNSSAADFMPVRLVDSSGTGFHGPTKPMPVSVTDSSNAVVLPGDSANSAIRVNVVAGAAAGSTLVTVRQSTYTDFNTLSRLADRDNSTAIAAVVQDTQPASTAYGLVVRMPAPITDSTNSAIRVNVVAGAAGGSTEVTVRQSTYTDFNTLSRLADRDASTQVANITNTTPASTAYGLVVRDAAPSTGPFAVSSIAGPVTVRSSAANALVSVYQSTAADLNVTVAGYSTTVNVSSLGGAVIVRSSAADALVTGYQSTYTDLNANVRLSDRDASTATAAVLGTTPASTTYGLVVREAVPQSTGPFAISSVGGVVAVSTGPVVISSVGGVVTVSTGPFAVSSIAGPVTVRSSAANALMTAYQSTAGDFQATVTLASTANSVLARVTTSSGGGVEGSTTTLSTGSALGLNVRVVQPSGRQSTTTLITSSNSTATYTLASSAAGVKQKVYAFSITSTIITPSTFIFCSVGSSNNTNNDRWAVVLGSGSSGITGANLVVPPPGFLFESETADGIKLRIENGASTQTVARVSLAWFSEA